MKKTLLSLSLIALALVGKAQNCTELFISEYVEGLGNNKAIEVYNPTSSNINLSNYRIIRYSNGSSYSNPIDDIDSTTLSGTIFSYSVHVLVNGQTTTVGTSPPCSTVLQSLANQLDHAYGAPTYMNGDDAIALVRINPYKILDIFGKIGEQPATAWSDVAPYIGTTGKWWTKDHSLQRKASIKGGVMANPSSFNVKLEWDSLPKDNWSKLGAHTCNCFVALTTSVSAGSSSLCLTYTTPISATTTGGNGTVSFTWSPASQIQGSNNGSSIVASPSTASTIIYTVIASDGFSSTTNTISIQGVACAPLTTNLSSNSNTVCLTQTINISSTTSGGNNNYTYSWQPTSQIFGTANSMNIVAKPTNTVSPVIYTLTVNDAGTVITRTISIQASDCGLVFTPTISAASSTVCTNQFLTISAESTFGGSGSYTYTWSPASEITGSTNTGSISAHPSSTITTTIVYSVTVSDGLAAPVTMTMAINPVVCDVLVKENAKEVYLNMFPNPNNGNEISFMSDKTILSIKIVNAIGQVVYSTLSNDKTIVVKNLDLTNGLYYAIIKNENGTITKKLIIQ